MDVFDVVGPSEVYITLQVVRGNVT
jgi:hypothetical protein